MQFVTANGMRTAYAESGSGEPLLLIHGGHGSHRSYDFFRPLLGEGIRAIAFDQRDAPDTPYSGGPYTNRDIADDCVAFIEALGLKRAHLMGTSFGGTVAMLVAIHYPEYVQSLILAATTPAKAMTEPALTPAMTETDPEKLRRIMLEISITPEAVDTDPKLVADIMAGVRERPAHIIERRQGSVDNHDCRADLHRIQAPTLVLHGDEDPVVSTETARWMADQIPGTELKIFPGLRHGFIHQDRQRTAQYVREFVLSHSGA